MQELELGVVLITIDGRVVATADNLLVTIAEADPEEVRRLKEAKFIVLYRPRLPAKEQFPREYPSRVPISKKDFGEKLKANFDRDYILALKGFEVAIMHGLVALAADHPGVQGMHKSTHDVIQHIRDWCKAVFIDWGLTPGQAEYFDTLREDAQPK